MSDKRPKDAIESQAATNRVSIYCTASDKEQWTTEAEDAGYSSRSEYLFELIQESRRYRAKGFLSREQKQSKVRRLKSEIERLEAELKNQSGHDQRLIQALENPELVRRVLSTEYQPLQEVTETVLHHDSVLMDAREPVERALFELAQRGEVHYERGHGWKLTDEDR